MVFLRGVDGRRLDYSIMHGKKSKSQSKMNWGSKKNRIRCEYDGDDDGGWRRFDKKRKSNKKKNHDEESEEYEEDERE